MNKLLKIDEFYKIYGRGTVITGLLEESLAVEDKILLEDGLFSIVKGIEGHRETLEFASAGEVVSILCNLDEKTLIKGQYLYKECEKDDKVKINNFTVNYGQSKKLTGGKYSISGIIIVDGNLDIFDCEIFFKQGGYIKVLGSLNIRNVTITVERKFYTDERIIYIEDRSIATLESVHFVGNHKSSAIGGIGNSKIIIRNSIFENFYAEVPGSCIYVNDAEVQLINSFFTDCHSTRSGGAVSFFCKDKGSIHVENCEFTSCSSDIKGGAISTGYDAKLFSKSEGAISFILSTFYECTSKGPGGAIYLNYDPTSTLKRRIASCGFQKCRALNGGGVYDEHEKVLVTDCVFEKCSPNNFERKTGGVIKNLLGKEFLEIVIDPTIEDFYELKDGLKEDFYEFHDEITKILKREIPPLGEWKEKEDRFRQMVDNGLNALIMDNRRSQTTFDVGDHLFIKCQRVVFFTHHGLYIGNGEVIHYAHGSIHITSLEEFSEGKEIYKRHSRQEYSNDEVVFRAKSRLGEKEYSLCFNNCEHFCNWARNGE